MYYIYGISRPSLLIESTDSMIDSIYRKIKCTVARELWQITIRDTRVEPEGDTWLSPIFHLGFLLKFSPSNHSAPFTE